MKILVHASRGGASEWRECDSQEAALQEFREHASRGWLVVALMIAHDGRLEGAALTQTAARDALRWNMLTTGGAS